MSRLRITEIFYSLQGESATVGLPTTFVRLTGCPLRCGYCDTRYAFTGGEWMDIPAILDRLSALQTSYVTVTGGEPLGQEACPELLVALCNAGYRVSLETSGALDIASVDPRVMKVMDLKTPGSEEEAKNRFQNIDFLLSTDQVKFVICNEADYHWARKQLETWELAQRCEVLFLPSHGQQDATQLAEWILRDHLPVRFQVQLHKYLWGDEAGR